MSITKFKTCRTCGAQTRAKWTESADTFWICQSCNEKPVGEVLSGQARRDRMAQQVKAAQYKPDPRSVAMARQMAHDTRPASRGTQQDPGVDPVLAILTYDALTTNDRADWDSSSHRQYEASSVSRTGGSGLSGDGCAPSEPVHHTSHDSGSSYDSGSDSSSYSSGGCD